MKLFVYFYLFINALFFPLLDEEIVLYFQTLFFGKIVSVIFALVNLGKSSDFPRIF